MASLTPSASCRSARLSAVSVPPFRLRSCKLKRSLVMMTPVAMASLMKRCQVLSRLVFCRGSPCSARNRCRRSALNCTGKPWRSTMASRRAIAASHALRSRGVHFTRLSLEAWAKHPCAVARPFGPVRHLRYFCFAAEGASTESCSNGIDSSAP